MICIKCLREMVYHAGLFSGFYRCPKYGGIKKEGNQK